MGSTVSASKKSFCCDGDGTGKKTAAVRVFEAARDLFYHRGIRAVGVDEIVCKAGVTKPSLYRAFASKDDLVAACLEESAREGRAAMREVLDAAGEDPRDQLRAVIRHFARKVAAPDFRGCPMSNTAVEIPEPGHPGRVVLEQCKADTRALIVSITRELHVDRPEELADGLLLVIEGAMSAHHIFGSQGPCAAMVATSDALIDAHLQTVKA
ncbi:TetR/AcrR family transcriptional regulator [Rhizorhabdus dicambivorans]|uniref:TetR/AcrR family transcriptional regulator n=1 Tax=Rhizorhabdus dicambivorans TaxID=1850238 RepID=A0A2A4G250_9SPHN|nr:TetR/AcrR family transcriptional regulator [Rhizorhabdus dicambivorans]PCE43810.1 TetR/AcrR family transcriptional regulator [Rhizorhabdus dicambivorans]